MKSRKFFVYLFSSLFLVLACQRKGGEFSQGVQHESFQLPAGAPSVESPRQMQSFSKMTPMSADAQAPSEVMPDRKIVYTADLRIEVPNFKEAVEKVVGIVKEVGGYVSSSSTQEDDYQKLSGTLSLRVPEKMFQQTLEKVRKVGKLKGENIQGDDITEEYVDIEIRLKNKRELENRLLDVLKKQTSKLSDLLEVEKELARVREEIERVEGRKRFLDNQVSLATITVNLFEPVPLTSSSQWGPLGRAVKEIVAVFANSVGTLMLVVVSVLPWVLLGGIFLWIVLRIVRRR